MADFRNIGGLRHLNDHRRRVTMKQVGAWIRQGKPRATCEHCGHNERAYLMAHEDGKTGCKDYAACEARIRLARELETFCVRRSA